MMMALVAIALLVGCASVTKVKMPVVKETPIVKEAPKTYDLYDLYLTKDPQQMTGVARDMAKLSVGETVTIYARGCSSIETGGKWFELPADVVVTWKADRKLEVTPTTGHVVTVKVISPISVSAYVTATTTAKDGSKIEKGFTITPKNKTCCPSRMPNVRVGHGNNGGMNQ